MKCLSTPGHLRLAVLMLLYLLLVGIAKLCEPLGRWPFWAIDIIPAVILVLPVYLASVIYAFRRQPRYAIMMVVIASVCLAFWTDTVLWRLPSHSTGRSIRLITWNTKWNSGLAELPQLLQRENPDIVCLQELMGEGRTDAIWHKLRQQGWHVAVEKQYAVISKYPINVTDSAPYMLKTTLNVDGRQVRLTTAHLWLPYSMYARTPGQFRRSLRPMAWQRKLQLDAVLQDPKPDVICGDLNTPPHTSLTSRLASKYQDSHVAAGTGAGYSYPSSLPIVRIDHVYVSKQMRVVSSRTLALPKSDHRAVMVEFQLNR